MKVQDVLNEIWDDDEDQREFENPVPHDPSKTNAAFEHMEDVDGALMDAYKREHGIEEFSSGVDYGKTLKAQRKRFGKITQVPLTNIIATETHLYKDQINNIIKGQNVKSSSEFPILYKIGSLYFVGDGNHRVAAEMIRGGKSVEAIVLDSDKILKQIKK